MATFTATANSNTTIGYAQYGSTTWNRGTTNGACQGAYQGTSASRSRVGVMVFSGAGAAQLAAALGGAAQLLWQSEGQCAFLVRAAAPGDVRAAQARAF